MDTQVSVKGQVVIPAPIRRKLGLKQGTRVQMELDERGRRVILTPITEEYIRELRGQYRDKNLLRSLAKEKERERDL